MQPNKLMQAKKIALYTGIGTTSIFLWELIAINNHCQFKPSIALKFLSEKSRQLFTYIGIYLAKVSSFYTYLDLSTFYEAIENLANPLITLVFSPLYSINGYITQSNKYKYPLVVTFGSLTLGFIGLFLHFKYNLLNRCFQSLKSNKYIIKK